VINYDDSTLASTIAQRYSRLDARFLDAAEYYDDDFGRPGELIALFSPINYAGDKNADNVSGGGGDETNRSDLGARRVPTIP